MSTSGLSSTYTIKSKILRSYEGLMETFIGYKGIKSSRILLLTVANANFYILKVLVI